MCGIFGYIGSKNASEVVLEGLKRLEYRGYDSWGIAVTSEEIKIDKNVGAIGDLNRSNLPSSKIGIGHTRWATHGGVTKLNAHPHFSLDKSFCLAQNGIVENYLDLKKNLIKQGYKFETETDTEVIVRLVEHEQKKVRDLRDAIRSAFLKLKGRNTIIVLTKDDEIIAARNGSPLVLGKTNEEIFLSSDTLSFAPFAKDMIVVENGQLVLCSQGKIEVFDIKTARKVSKKTEKVSVANDRINKEGYDHFMLKEIHESPYVINQVAVGSSSYQDFVKALKKAPNVYTIGSGTAGVAAAQIAFYLRSIAKLSTISLIGADSDEYINLFSENDVLVAPSQSGETADVLEVLEVAQKKDVKIASYVNMPGSTMTRISDFKFMANAGPEICVVSTKVFTSQIAWGYLLSKLISGKRKEGQENLKLLAGEMEKYLNTQTNHQQIKNLAKMLLGKKDIFLLGKAQNYNIIREGMVKLIECSYKHAHAMPAGDLKHYAITLIEKGVPVIVAVSEDNVKLDVLNAVNEVKARGAEVIGISTDNADSFDYWLKVPNTGETQAIMNIIPLQLLAYYMAVSLGHNVDKPRNIAKSVTVK